MSIINSKNRQGDAANLHVLFKPRKKRFSTFLLLAFLSSLLVFFPQPVLATSADHCQAFPNATAEDELKLLNGQTLRGKIVSQTKDVVVIALPNRGNTRVSKDKIVRIYDRPEVEAHLSDLLPRQGQFPPWWVISYDLFNEDWVRRFEQIPATVIPNGVLKNVPYLSFQANKHYELNIYGNPRNPAAIEFGVYGDLCESPEAQCICRQFMLSYLTTRSQIVAIYELPNSGAKKTIDGVTIEIVSPKALDSHGGWWVRIYNTALLNQARVPESMLASVTEKNASIIKRTFSTTKWDKRDLAKIRKKLAKNASELVFEKPGNISH